MELKWVNNGDQKSFTPDLLFKQQSSLASKQGLIFNQIKHDTEINKAVNIMQSVLLVRHLELC